MCPKCDINGKRRRQSGPESFLGILKAVIRRKGGLVGFAQKIGEILRGEGMRGISFRARMLFQAGGKDVAAVYGETRTRDDRRAIPVSSQEGPNRPTTRPLVCSDLLPGALLVGHPYGVLGRGEDVRSAANAFASAGIPFSIQNTFGEYGKENLILYKDFQLAEKITTSKSYKANVFYLNADEMDNAYQYLGGNFFRGKYNIGCWQWELSDFPDEWCSALRYLHEIWAPSRFVQQAISKRANCPVIWMPLAVELRESVRLSREYFGLPERTFLFLFFFDFRSYIGRKNPGAILRAFQRAFGAARSDGIGLVIKINGMDECPNEYREFCKSEEIKDQHVILLDKVMDDREIKELVRLCDCFVSLHRSEGFGRGLAEAMFFGKPVIATGYSGNLDFTNAMNCCLVDHVLIPVQPDEYPFGKGQLWADPDIEQATWYMKRLVENPAYAAKKGINGKRYIKSFHSFHAVGVRYRRRLEQLKLI